jgi:hypothetical protein
VLGHPASSHLIDSFDPSIAFIYDAARSIPPVAVMYHSDTRGTPEQPPAAGVVSREFSRRPV